MLHPRRAARIATPIRRNSPTLGEAEAAAAARAVVSRWVARGPETAGFENELCALHGLDAGHAVAVSSGTAALYLALWVLGASGKRVALPAYACQALLHAVRAIRANPLFIDSRSPRDPNIDSEAANAHGADLAILPHTFGIAQAVDSARIPIIEDCAQALGATYGRKPVGLQGTIAAFSFGATKMITTGGAGGAVLSRDRQLISQVRDYLAYADRDDNLARFNFEITDVQAAIGRVQLRRLSEFCERREKLFDIYLRNGLELVDASDSLSGPVRFSAVVLSSCMHELAEHLCKRGIPALQPLAVRHLLGNGGMPNASAFARSALSLPLYPLLSDEECLYVAQTVSAFGR